MKYIVSFSVVVHADNEETAVVSSIKKLAKDINCLEDYCSDIKESQHPRAMLTEGKTRGNIKHHSPGSETRPIQPPKGSGSADRLRRNN